MVVYNFDISYTQTDRAKNAQKNFVYNSFCGYAN